MKREALAYLVCPCDGSNFDMTVEVADNGEIIGGTLGCLEGHVFQISAGVPGLLPVALREDHAIQTQQSFSAKWRRIPTFGFDQASRDTYVQWYLERYGFRDLDGLRAFLADKQLILDAGTGVGRDTGLYAENCQGQVFGVDISESVFSAYKNVGHLPNAHLIHADLTALPFRERTFDYVVSDQVIHHTPDTRASFLGLARYVKPGGQLSVYVYSKKGAIRELADDYLRNYYTETSEDECYEFSRVITLLGKALSELKVEVDVPEDIPILGIKAGPIDVQRFIYWHILKCYWNGALDLETNVMTNFDWYHPRYAYRHTPEEVRGWCEEAGLDIVHFDVVESGISVRAQRPVSDQLP